MVKTAMLWKMVVIVGGIGVTLAVIRTAYYYIPWGSENEPPAVVETLPPQVQQPPEQRFEYPRNPLLVATRDQFVEWMPPYCGADLFSPGSEIRQVRRNVCITGTIERVESATGRRITPQDVMDPAVRQHWRSVVMG